VDYLDPQTQASHPGAVVLSLEKAARLCPELLATPGSEEERGFRKWAGESPEWWLGLLKAYLLQGDSRAAMVVSTRPLLVAAYTDELDCVVLLRFPQSFVRQYELKKGSRLLTVNTYRWRKDNPVPRDLKEGPRARRIYGNFQPLIADFLSDNKGPIEQRKAHIDQNEWDRCQQLGHEYIKSSKRPRRGHPLLTDLTAREADQLFHPLSLTTKASVGNSKVTPLRTFLFGLGMILVLIAFVIKETKGGSHWLVAAPGLLLIWGVIAVSAVQR